MLIEVISFIPFITCLFWLVLNLLLNKNGKEFRTLGYLLSLLGIISFAQTVILYGENDLVLPCFLARQFFMLLLIPALLLITLVLTLLRSREDAAGKTKRQGESTLCDEAQAGAGALNEATLHDEAQATPQEVQS